MGNFKTWFYVALALITAVAGNSLSAIWASKGAKVSPWLFAVILFSPLVFITFGLVASRIGVALGSATLDSLLTVITILVGLIAFGEWNRISPLQYVGLGFVLVGIVLMQFTMKSGA